jgi:levansucrase
MQSIVEILNRGLNRRTYNFLFRVHILASLQTAVKMSVWAASHVSGIASQNLPTIPLVKSDDAVSLLPGYDLWDLWPVQTVDGKTADFAGFAVWMILSAPALANPDERHDIARIRMMTERGGVWKDCGNLFPDGHCPGSREWAGSALYDPETKTLTSFHTAAGRRGTAATFEQRIFQSSAQLNVTDGNAVTANWTPMQECFQNDGTHYVIANHAAGKPGMIKGFRDPAHFRDPADGTDYLLFTGSLAGSDSEFNGVAGIARSASGHHSNWEILPPIISADGLCNEQERPHIVYRDGLYYLFWSSQGKVFSPSAPKVPTALFGMVADNVLGPYRPLNGTGLVAANPAEEPFQTYSWWVTDDLYVAGFTDLWGMEGRTLDTHPQLRRSHFGGTPAPRFRLSLHGDIAKIA